MSRVQVFLGFSNFWGEVAIPATLFCFSEIETETRDSDSPTSQSNLPWARTAPLTIFRGDSKLDRMFHLPRFAMRTWSSMTPYLAARQPARSNRSRPRFG